MDRAEKAAQARRQPVEQLLTDTLAAALPPSAQGDPDRLPPAARLSDFDREVVAFEQHKPHIQAQYPDRVVAIYHGEVVMVGDDKLAVFDAVLKKYGPIPAYIEWVDGETPRRARHSSARVAP